MNRWDGYGELYHHGIKGQKWGVRRYQNEDGTLTEEGKERYGRQEAKKDRYNEATAPGKVSIMAERATKPALGIAAGLGAAKGAIGIANMAINNPMMASLIAGGSKAVTAGLIGGTLVGLPLAAGISMIAPAVILGGTRLVGRMLENTNRSVDDKMEKSDKEYYEKYKDRYIKD